jgi:glycosyltransferase involved in cell wall biosynthesis
VVLIRVGKDYCDDLDQSMQKLRADNVIHLGYLDHEKLLRVLKLADIYIQPGRADEFNKFRIPSKIPEFLALGKPVIVPRANIGLKLKDGVEALLLNRGDGVEIADRVEAVLDDRSLAQTLSRGARAYAERELNWNERARSLLEFYESIVFQSRA